MTATQPLSHFPSSAGQREETGWKSLWVKVKMGRSHTSFHHGQNRLAYGKIVLIRRQLKIESDGEKQNLKLLSSQSQLHSFIPDSSTSPCPEWCRGPMG